MPPNKTKASLPLADTGGNTVDIYRSKRIANIFFFFVSAAKASLFPFLTIYFRLMGLSPVQTAIIFGTRALVLAVFVPFWLKISYLCNKKKLLMLVSIFVLIISHLSLTGVPPANRDTLLIWCPAENSLNSSNQTPTIEPETYNVTEVHTTLIGNSTTTAPPTSHSTELSNATSHTTAESSVPTTPGLSTPGANILPAVTQSSTGGVQIAGNTSPGSDDINKSSTSSIATNTPEPAAPIRKTREHGSRHKRSITQTFADLKLSIGDKINQWQSTVYSIENRTFILVLIIIVLGEMFSCAAEKLADDAWFTLLDSVDDVEKYGSHKYWSSIAYIFYAVIVAMVVDTRECFLSSKIHHFMLHFYVFAVLLCFAFFTGFFYPFYPREKPSKRHTLSHNKAKILCSDLRSAIYVITIFLMGCMNATITCFLFWLVQDKGGSEIQMGVTIMVASISELFMLVFAKPIVHRLGIPFTVVIGIAAMAARLLYFSFLWTPWAVIAIEILYGLSNTAVWHAICAHPDFSLNIISRRYTQNIFYILYHGLGCALGCLLAGFGYAYKTLPVVYQCACVVAMIWCVIFAVAQKCLPKPAQIKYARLLGENDESPSESDEDDWLEMALKNH